MAYINCFWYHEYQDMNAKVPTCEYYCEYGKCPCDECNKRFYISKQEVNIIIREICDEKGGTK